MAVNHVLINTSHVVRAALRCAAAPRVSSELARFENWGSKGRKGVASLLALRSTLHCFVAMAPRDHCCAGELVGDHGLHGQ